MRTDSWGRGNYARAMIELKANVDLRDTIVVVVPKLCGEGFTMSTIHVKKIVSDISKNSKMPRQPPRGPQVGVKPKSTFMYRPISTKKAAKANGNPKVKTANKATTPILNSSDALSTMVDEEEGHGKPLKMKVKNKASDSKPKLLWGTNW
ncbi:hypothetical protein Tco_0228249 [Tanacetum coccineum]